MVTSSRVARACLHLLVFCAAVFFAALAVLFGLSWIYELLGLLRGSCGRIGFPSHSAPTALTFVLCLFPTVP
jgi:hypothetical protein